MKAINVNCCYYHFLAFSVAHHSTNFPEDLSVTIIDSKELAKEYYIENFAVCSTNTILFKNNEKISLPLTWPIRLHPRMGILTPTNELNYFGNEYEHIEVENLK